MDDLLSKLMELEGYRQLDHLITDSLADGVCAGICEVCHWIDYVPHTEKAGYCEKCKTMTIISALLLVENNDRTSEVSNPVIGKIDNSRYWKEAI